MKELHLPVFGALKIDVVRIIFTPPSLKAILVYCRNPKRGRYTGARPFSHLLCRGTNSTRNEEVELRATVLHLRDKPVHAAFGTVRSWLEPRICDLDPRLCRRRRSSQVSQRNVVRYARVGKPAYRFSCRRHCAWSGVQSGKANESQAETSGQPEGQAHREPDRRHALLRGSAGGWTLSHSRPHQAI